MLILSGWGDSLGALKASLVRPSVVLDARYESAEAILRCGRYQPIRSLRAHRFEEKALYGGRGFATGESQRQREADVDRSLVRMVRIDDDPRVEGE